MKLRPRKHHTRKHHSGARPPTGIGVSRCALRRAPRIVAGLLRNRRPVTSADRKATENVLAGRGPVGSLKRDRESIGSPQALIVIRPDGGFDVRIGQGTARRGTMR